jgi:hypothetical protein
MCRCLPVFTHAVAIVPKNGNTMHSLSVNESLQTLQSLLWRQALDDFHMADAGWQHESQFAAFCLLVQHHAIDDVLVSSLKLFGNSRQEGRVESAIPFDDEFRLT